MPEHREFEVFRPHAHAVIADPDQAAPTLLDQHIDAARAGINGVLDQLLHRRSRALDHLTGSDLVYEDGVETADWHQRFAGWIECSNHTFLPRLAYSARIMAVKNVFFAQEAPVIPFAGSQKSLSSADRIRSNLVDLANISSGKALSGLGKKVKAPTEADFDKALTTLGYSDKAKTDYQKSLAALESLTEATRGKTGPRARLDDAKSRMALVSQRISMLKALVTSGGNVNRHTLAEIRALARELKAIGQQVASIGTSVESEAGIAIAPEGALAANAEIPDIGEALAGAKPADQTVAANMVEPENEAQTSGDVTIDDESARFLRERLELKQQVEAALRLVRALESIAKRQIDDETWGHRRLNKFA